MVCFGQGLLSILYCLFNHERKLFASLEEDEMEGLPGE
jgi:hypothetical protein